MTSLDVSEIAYIVSVGRIMSNSGLLVRVLSCRSSVYYFSRARIIHIKLEILVLIVHPLLN